MTVRKELELDPVSLEIDKLIEEMGLQAPTPSDPRPQTPTPKTAATPKGSPLATTPQAQAPQESEFTILRSKVLRPYVGLVYGCPGVGKTTLCSSIPNSLVIDLERGGDGLDCTRIAITEQETPRATIAKIKRAIGYGVQQGYTTIIIDSITSLANIFERQYLLENQKTALDADFGRDYDKLNTLVKDFLGGQTASTGVMRYLASNQCNLLLIGHEKEKIDTVGDSKLMHSTFPSLYKGLVGWLNIQCDFIFYYTFDILIREEQLGMTKEKLSATRGRKLITSQEGGIMAKNRFEFIKPSLSNPTFKVFTSIFDAEANRSKDTNLLLEAQATQALKGVKS
jgi:Cdc6-like AAA superfamily ATPase